MPRLSRAFRTPTVLREFLRNALLRRLGRWGLVFCASVLVTAASMMAGWTSLAVVSLLVLLVSGSVLFVRGTRWALAHSLWSLRNRLLLVYGLFGVLPVLLFLTLTALGAWTLMNELAIYLASSALDRRLDGVDSVVQILKDYPPERRLNIAADITRNIRNKEPGFALCVRDAAGEHRFPPDAQPLHLAAGWQNVHGLLVANEHFYAWSHSVDRGDDLVAYALLTDGEVTHLVPHLGDISIFEVPDKGHQHRILAHAGSATLKQSTDARGNVDFQLRSSDRDGGDRTRSTNLPPPAFSLDVPVFIPATRSHFHPDAPGQNFSSVLYVHSRPSAVMNAFFSGTEVIREVVFNGLIAIGILFLVVELVAIFVGVSLSRRITQAINQMYEGTRRVIRGDFSHRLPVRTHDQLGELSQSFNQMTGNLQRLLSVEKEKERLQTELEIAREVQGQLYPKAAPPSCGLRLTVRCDPARMVSGDYYDYGEIGGGRMMFAIGDVAGKGISAALLMATLQAALRAQLGEYNPVRESECTHRPEVDAARLVSRLNRQIYAHTSPEKYATFFFALFDQTSCTLTYTNAGHLSPLLFQNGNVRPLDSNGTVVGAFPGANYDESCLTMESGDLLVCYTDGITEPENAYGEMFGEERLIDLIQRNLSRDDGEIMDIVLTAVRSWTGSPELSDDMTLLLARQVSAA